jgi:hypothetical protein
MRGLGQLKNPKSFMGAALPPVLGGGITGLTILATRYWAKPSEGETPKQLFRWAPIVGLAAGGVGSLALYYLGGAPAAVSSFSTSLLVSISQLMHDMFIKDRMGEFMIAHPPAALAPVEGGGTAGFGVVVPERLMGAGNGMQGIVMEPTASRDPLRRYGLGSMGEEVSLGSVNPRAFGTPGFGY